MTRITAVLLLIAVPSFAGGTSAISALFGSAAAESSAAPAAPSRPSQYAEKVPVRAWDEEVKKACEAYMADGRIASLPEAAGPELPSALRGSGSTVRRLVVGGLPAFVETGKNGSPAIRVFDACGRLVAAGEPAGTAPFRWQDVSSFPEAGAVCGLKAASLGGGQPDGPYDGGPDGGGYWDDGGGGPDSDYDGGGCGGSGSGGWDGGFDGSGSVAF